MAPKAPTEGRVERALVTLKRLVKRIDEVYELSPEPLQKLWRTLGKSLQVVCWTFFLVVVIGPLLLLAEQMGLDLQVVDWVRQLAE